MFVRILRVWLGLFLRPYILRPYIIAIKLHVACTISLHMYLVINASNNMTNHLIVIIEQRV